MTADQTTTVANYLRVAASKFVDNAKVCREQGSQHEMLAIQFSIQSDEANQLASLFDDAATVTLNFVPEEAEDETKYKVIDLDADEPHGLFDTLEEARGCVKFDNLKAYEIRHNGVAIERCEAYEGNDDRAKQGLGLVNASER